jgi:hypothetical protein
MNRIGILAGVIFLIGGSTANAVTLSYTDRATWEAQVSSLFTFDSGTQAVGTATGFYTSAGLAIPELQIVGYNNASYDLTRVNASASQTWYQWGSGAMLRTADKTASNTVFIRINFPTPVNAFGFNYGVGGSGGAPGNVTIAPQGLVSVDTVSSQQPAWKFYGVVSDTLTFSYVDIYANDTNRYLLLDDISKAVYSPQQVPTTETLEAGTWLQVMIGGLLLYTGRRRWLRHANAF